MREQSPVVDAPGTASPSSASTIEGSLAVPPEEALRAIESHDGPVLVDLDETAYLRNSTEDFINLAWPGLIALFLLRLLDVVKPWRFTGGDVTRDVWRVRLIVSVFPWTIRRWRSALPQLAAQFANKPLIAAISGKRPPAVIVTVGFDAIVIPLVAALGLSEVRVIASRLKSFADRRNGKLLSALTALGETTVRDALVITDSPQDLPLLQNCSRPLLTIWPDARYIPALSGIYIPGQYISRIKRPGEHFFRRAILLGDLALWVFSSIELAPHPVHHIIGLGLLIFSFWAIYERGYVDNDYVAANFEQAPKLTEAYWNNPVATPRLQPWIWSAGAGFLGILVLRWPARASPADFALWAATLACMYGCFKLYNRLDKTTRIWLYPELQLARSASFLVLVPVLPIGAMAIAANVFALWIPYYIYRFRPEHGSWSNAQSGVIRVIFFAMLAALLATAMGPSAILNWTALALCLWILYRARQELWTLIKNIRWIKRRALSP